MDRFKETSRRKYAFYHVTREKLCRDGCMKGINFTIKFGG